VIVITRMMVRALKLRKTLQPADQIL
jgi:hypothetical protein